MKKDKKVVEPTVKRNWTFYTILGKIADILIYPAVILCLVCCFVMVSARRQGKVPSIFGLSLVQITSGSMKKDDFQIKDTVFVTKVDTDSLRPGENETGDIIAFYYYNTKDDASKTGKTLIDNFYDLPFQDSDDIDFYEGRITMKEIHEKKARVYFHRVINVYMDEDGIRYFETKGSSNGSADTYLIREDQVVGKYLNTPRWIRDVLKFFNSSMGMIITVVAPLSILILFQSLSIIEQVNNIMLERKILNGEEKWDTEEARKANIGFEMDLPSQIYFYSISNPNERKALFEFLWAEIGKSEKQKDKEVYSNCVVASKMLGRNPQTYWNFWEKRMTTKRNKKQFAKYKEAYKNKQKITNIANTMKR